jgi:hypothetical protein
MSGEDYQRKKRISVKPAYFVVSQLMRLTQTLLSILSQFVFYLASRSRGITRELAAWWRNADAYQSAPGSREISENPGKSFDHDAAKSIRGCVGSNVGSPLPTASGFLACFSHSGFPICRNA